MQRTASRNGVLNTKTGFGRLNLGKVDSPGWVSSNPIRRQIPAPFRVFAPCVHPRGPAIRTEVDPPLGRVWWIGGQEHVSLSLRPFTTVGRCSRDLADRTKTI